MQGEEIVAVLSVFGVFHGIFSPAINRMFLTSHKRVAMPSHIANIPKS
jgi:hypothetical protein